MGKEYHDEEGVSLLLEEKKFKQRKRKFRATCPHCTKKGKSLLKSTGTEDLHVCDRKGCGVKVDYRPYTFSDPEIGIKKLEDSVAVVKNALEICKHRAALDGDNKSSQNVQARAAALILEIDSVPDLLMALMEDPKGKKKNKKKKNRHTIEHGLGALKLGKKKDKKGGW